MVTHRVVSVGSSLGASGERVLRTQGDANGVADQQVIREVQVQGRLWYAVPYLPPAAKLDNLAYRTIAFAFPIWTFAVIAGAIWAESAWGRFWGWDPKETWAFIAWVVYAAYLHARTTAGWRGRPAAWVNVVGLIIMVFNLTFVNLVSSGLHSYGGK